MLKIVRSFFAFFSKVGENRLGSATINIYKRLKPGFGCFN